MNQPDRIALSLLDERFEYSELRSQVSEAKKDEDNHFFASVPTDSSGFSEALKEARDTEIPDNYPAIEA